MYRHAVLSATHEGLEKTLHLLDLRRLLVSMKMFSVPNQRPVHKLKCVLVHRFKSFHYRSLRAKRFNDRATDENTLGSYEEVGN
jgi:hypothetical protein